MTLKNLYDAIKSAGFPAAFSSFKKKTEPPFVTYLDKSRSPVAGDGRAAGWVHNIRVELYTREKDQAAEAKVEAVFDRLGLLYEVADEGEIDTESAYRVGYEFDFYIAAGDDPAAQQNGGKPQ